MKKFLTLFCALLGMSAMAIADYSPSVDAQGYLDISGLNAGNIEFGKYEFDEDDGVLTITYPGEYYKTAESWESGTMYSWDETSQSYIEDSTNGTFLKHDGTYECFGWGFWSGTYVPTDYTNLAVTLEGTTGEWAQLQVEPSASGADNVTADGTFDTDGNLTLDVELSDECLAGITQFYIQNGKAEQVIKVISVQFYDATVAEEPEVSANVAYNFDDEAFASLQNDGSGTSFTSGSSNQTVGGVTFIVGESDNLKFQANEGDVMVGEDRNGDPITISPAYRVSLGGGGSTTKTAISIPVEGACKLYVVAASSSSNEVRYLVVSDGTSQINTVENGGSANADNTKIGFAAPKDMSTENCLFSCDYSGDAKDLYLYSAGSGIYVFYIYVSYDGTEPVFDDAEVVEPKEFELEGYLTVSVAGTTTTQEVTVNVTKSDDDDSMTVELGDLAVSIATITDASVTFTPDETGAYTNGEVSGTVSILDKEDALSDVTATGSYIVDADGATTFIASFTYGMEIVVTFTTVEPEAEPEWLLVTDEVSLVSGEFTEITWEQLGDATQICIVATCSDPDSEYATGENFGGIYYSDNWGTVKEFAYKENIQESYTFTFDVEELKALTDEALDATSEAIYLCFYGPTTSVKVYAYATELGSEDTESGNQEETIEDFVLDIAGCVTDSNVNIWSEDCVPTVNADGTSVDVAFSGAWAGFGFIQPSWASWDLTDYEAAVMTYEFETGYTPTASDYVTFQLQTAGDKAYVVSEADYENTGKITLVFADHTVGTYTDWSNDATEDATMDYSNINQIGVQASTAFNITIKEIRFIVKSTTGDIEGEDEGGSTAISNVNVEVTEVARYNLMGQKISGAQKGINIIVYSDGSAKKVLVK